MTKPKTVQKFEAEHDGDAPLGQRKLKGPAADLVAFEDSGLGKLPKAFDNALADLALVETEWLPAVGQIRKRAENALDAAKREQRPGDAVTVQDLARRGPEAFASIADLADVDKVAEAEAEFRKAQRLSQATLDASKGLTAYIAALAGGEGREPLLKALGRAWENGVNFTPTSSTTLGELHRMESVSDEARDLIGRLVLFVEHQNQQRGMTPADTKRLREALKQDRAEMPTMAILDAEIAAQEIESPEYLKAQAAAKDLAARREHDRKSAAEAAAYRTGQKSPEARGAEGAKADTATTTSGR